MDDVFHEPGDVAVRVTPDGVILVDDKFDVNVPQIFNLIKTVTDKPVKYLINSHFHSDHAGGNGEMIKHGVIIVDQKDLRDSYDKAKKAGRPRRRSSSTTTAPFIWAASRWRPTISVPGIPAATPSSTSRT